MAKLSNADARKLVDVNDAWAAEGIWTIKPRNGEPGSDDGPIEQAGIIATIAGDICKEVGANVVIWDTMTATAVNMLTEESILRGKNASNPIKHKTSIGDDYYVPQLESRFMVQDMVRNNVRGVMIRPSRNYHVIHIMHQETAKKMAGKDPKGNQLYAPSAHGCDAGGPGSVEKYGREFRAVHRIYVGADKKRFVQLNQTLGVSKVPFLCQTRTGGKALPNEIEIPADSYEKALAIRQRIVDNIGLDLSNPKKYGYYSEALFALAGAGKTRWASTFLGLPGVTGCLYIAADGDSEWLGSFWDEVKQPKGKK